MNKHRVVFMGSPDFAVPSLLQLVEHTDVVCVVTQPDRPSGRGRAPSASAVKLCALEQELEIYQPEKLSSEEAVHTLTALEPDAIVVAAYGQILREWVLDLPGLGCINVHASLLPRWRGASPIQASILAGDSSTGVSIMLMDKGIDTGPLLSQQEVQIPESATGGELFTILSHLGAELLVPTLQEYAAGRIKPVPQNDSLSTYAPMLKKTDGLLDFNKSAAVLGCQVRAFEPWPSSFFYFNNRRITVRAAHTAASYTKKPGRALVLDGLPAVTCRDGVIVFDSIQPAGKQTMPGDAFLRGARDFTGTDLMPVTD